MSAVSSAPDHSSCESKRPQKPSSNQTQALLLVLRVEGILYRESCRTFFDALAVNTPEGQVQQHRDKYEDLATILLIGTDRRQPRSIDLRTGFILGPGQQVGC